MLSTYESELFKKVAANPVSVPRQLVSPEINMAGAWFTTPLALRVFPAIARDALNDKPSSFISLMSQCQFSPEERDYLMGLWKSGKELNDTDITPVITVMRDDSMKREVNRIWDRYNANLKSDPSGLRLHVDSMGASLAMVAHDGYDYSPLPSSHRNDIDVRIGSSWGCNTIDAMFDGGIPNMGYALAVAPTGSGKSSMLRSLAVYGIAQSVIGNKSNVCICTNEMRAGETSRTIHAALMDVWAGERDEDQIWSDMDTHMRIYERVNDWEKLDRILYWERPKIAIIDSLDNLSFPASTEKFQKDDERHKARANGIADMSIRYGSFIGVVGNASEANQKELREGVMKIQSVMAFASAWYQNLSTWAFAIARSKSEPNTTEIKRVKNRPRGFVGEVWTMAYSPNGKYYRDAQYINLNP